MEQAELERLAQEFEAQQNTTEQQTEAVEAHPVVMTETNQIAEQSTVSASLSFSSVVGGVQSNILKKAQEKISDEKIVDKHAENLKKVADEALRVQSEQASLTVQEHEADNKVRKQEIKNKLIVLKAESKRLKKEQKQLNKEQKINYKWRNKQAKWDIYGDKLTKMNYSYVPNAFVLDMLLFFYGVRSFFDGLGTVSTTIVKALRWVFLIGIILGLLFIIPVTREWILNLLSGGK